MKRKLIMFAVLALAMGTAVAGFALATPSSGVVSVEYGRETRAKFTAHFEDRDMVVSELSLAPGAFTGWLRHPGKELIGVARGSVTLYLASDPSCAGTTYEAGEAFVVHPSQVHQVRNEGDVVAVMNQTFLGVPIGGSTRIDEPQPANCV